MQEYFFLNNIVFEPLKPSNTASNYDFIYLLLFLLVIKSDIKFKILYAGFSISVFMMKLSMLISFNCFMILTDNIIEDFLIILSFKIIFFLLFVYSNKIK